MEIHGKEGKNWQCTVGAIVTVRWKWYGCLRDADGNAKTNTVELDFFFIRHVCYFARTYIDFRLEMEISKGEDTATWQQKFEL